jgi:hypothetical protein
MPTSVQKMVPASSKLNEEEREQVIHRLNHVIRIKLLNSQVPKQFNDIVIGTSVDVVGSPKLIDAFTKYRQWTVTLDR